MNLDNLIIEAGERVRSEFFAVSDSLTFSEWSGALDKLQVTSAHLEILTGVSEIHISNKRRAGAAERNPSSTAHKASLSLIPTYKNKALSVADHGSDGWERDWSRRWIEVVPDEFRISIYETHIKAACDCEMNPAVAVYRHELGRKPTPQGEANFLRHLETEPLWKLIKVMHENKQMGAK